MRFPRNAPSAHYAGGFPNTVRTISIARSNNSSSDALNFDRGSGAPSIGSRPGTAAPSSNDFGIQNVVASIIQQQDHPYSRKKGRAR
jgi:hypothetical protein